MSSLPIIVFLLCNTLWVLSCPIEAIEPIYLKHWTFEELDRMNITCKGNYIARDYSCLARSGFPNYVQENACHCQSSCSQLGICCWDSSFQDWNPKAAVGSCRSVESLGSYFLIDKCPSTENTNDAFQTLCEDEQIDEDDLVSRIPVTSSSSNLSYKNYFCFRCYESNEDYTLWNVALSPPVEFKSRRYGEVNLTYNKAFGKWFASDGEKDTIHPVSVSIEIPKEVTHFPIPCDKYLISSCSVEWPQDEIREKCSMYMFVIQMTREYPYLLYKNPHCALCNFKVLEDYHCRFPYGFGYGFGNSRKLYSFTLVMDIGRKDGEKVGKTQRCDDAEAWDPFFKKCRKLMCVKPGYTIKEGKCKPS